MLLSASASAALAQSSTQRLPITLDADSSVFDRRNNELVFSGPRITQGAIGIEAGRGVTKMAPGSKLNFSDSIWTFEGNVRIDINTAKIRSESATLVFKNHTLQSARVTGSPARFSDIGPDSGKPIEAHADEFEYDLSAFTVRFSGDARIAEGDNEVTGADLKYDLADKRINFQGNPENDERVRITIVPDEDLTNPDDGQ